MKLVGCRSEYSWVSETRIEGVFDQQVNVYTGDDAAYVELELQEVEAQNTSDLFFSFYVRNAADTHDPG